ASFGEMVARAFQKGIVTVGAVIDDLRPSATPPVHYLHIAFIIAVPDDAEPDRTALDAGEHVDLDWRPAQDLAMMAKAQLYPPHYQQICAFVASDHRYAQIEDIQ
ncbi:MAG: hypothetical protein ACREBW_05555, partial [Candidatus Micrarchaeaceae archaeon]